MTDYRTVMPKQNKAIPRGTLLPDKPISNFKRPFIVLDLTNQSRNTALAAMGAGSSPGEEFVFPYRTCVLIGKKIRFRRTRANLQAPFGPI